ncbi:MAG: carbamate kinase [Methanomicrobiales archaeon]|nr:carbamate kinase [Methanomicrobiales archaeon]MDD1670314.1 carbamate kinase [Methanomicrobiales archaeon]
MKKEKARGKGRVLVALGGNAILRHKGSGTAEEQLQNVRDISRIICRLAEAGYHLAITHGNGPQVGDILLKNEMAKKTLPPMPLDICGAESQGMIGYMLQQSLANELGLSGMGTRVATVLTQTRVDGKDPAFRDPQKPIGPFYTALEAKRLREEKGWTIVNDAGRGYRRVVPSPEPVEIVEGAMIRTLYDEGFIVIASGGGGVPVLADPEKGTLRGVEAVIDKDHSAAVLAKILGVRVLLILTDVDNAYLDFERPGQRPLGRITLDEAQGHLEAGHFLKGSMLPKMESAIRFLRSGGELSIVTSPGLAGKALSGRAGTIITRNP